MEFRSDLAIITVVPEEYDAVRRRFSGLRLYSDPQTTNLYGWMHGQVRTAAGQQLHLVLSLAGKQGISAATAAAIQTVRFWRPRALLLVGIAGGIRRDGLTNGDIVVSTMVVGYEYGKLTHDYAPRPDMVFQVSRALLASASTLATNSGSRVDQDAPSPSPTVHLGYVASGDKLVDTTSSAYFQRVLKWAPKILAVEMEGAGAANAIQSLDDLDMKVHFLMVRGISDFPLESAEEASGQTAERDSWKIRAAESAANFASDLVTKAWPFPPIARRDFGQNGQPKHSTSPRLYAAGALDAGDRFFADIRYRRVLGEPFVLLMGSHDVAPGEASSIRPDAASCRHAQLARLLRSGVFRVVLAHGQGAELAQESKRDSPWRQVSFARIDQISAIALAKFFSTTEPGIKILDLNAGVGGLDNQKTRILQQVSRSGLVILDYSESDTALEQLVATSGGAVWLIGGDIVRLIEHFDLEPRKSGSNILHENTVAYEKLIDEIEERILPQVRLTSSPDSDDSWDGAAPNRIGELAQLQNQLEQHLLHATASPTAAATRDEGRYDAVTEMRAKIDALSIEGEGTILGEYCLSEKIGSGATSAVFAARHVINQATAAVKVLSRAQVEDRSAVHRFFRGARIMHALSHPNIVRIFDLGSTTGPWCYYVMEFVDGPNLDALLESDCLEPEQRWLIARQILQAVAYAHGTAGEQPIVHRDLKPSNILITERLEAKLGDFDTAFFERGSELSFNSNLPIGTAFYIAPEMEGSPAIETQRSPRIDVFALGRILLRLMTNIAPRETTVSAFLNDEEGLRVALTSRMPGRPANILCKLITRATHRIPERRFVNAGEVLAAFESAFAERVPTPRTLETFDLQFSRIPSSEYPRPPPTVEGRGAGTHSATITISRSFLMLKTPVTRALWREVWGEASEGPAQLPMEHVSWFSAVSFCNALSTTHGLECCYEISEDGVKWRRSANGFRLPTEAEWELACADARTVRSDGATFLDAIGWYSGNCKEGPQPVGLKAPNDLGLYDLLGNVWEWCWDWHAPLLDQDATDPIGPDTGSLRVLKGGSWRRPPEFCSPWVRYDGDPRNGGRSLGFRVVRTAEPS